MRCPNTKRKEGITRCCTERVLLLLQVTLRFGAQREIVAFSCCLSLIPVPPSQGCFGWERTFVPICSHKLRNVSECVFVSIQAFLSLPVLAILMQTVTIGRRLVVNIASSTACHERRKLWSTHTVQRSADLHYSTVGRRRDFQPELSTTLQNVVDVDVVVVMCAAV